MSYTLSFDASLKITQSNKMGGYFNHLARELNETWIEHSNENIDHGLSGNNITLVYDPKQEKLVKAESHDDIEAAINHRLSAAVTKVIEPATTENGEEMIEKLRYKTTGKSVRHDAVLAYGLITFVTAADNL